MLVAVGTFFAQATATGFVGRAATSDRGSASGIYLACYFCGGLVGTAVLGQIFDRFGWPACVAGIALALGVAALLALRLKMPFGEGAAHGCGEGIADISASTRIRACAQANFGRGRECRGLRQ